MHLLLSTLHYVFREALGLEVLQMSDALVPVCTGSVRQIFIPLMTLMGCGPQVLHVNDVITPVCTGSVRQAVQM